jgi:arginine N-succinyltransferase
MILRGAAARDLKGDYELAKHLDSYNLPADRKKIAELIALSEKSFAGGLKNPHDARFLFVLEDVENKKIAGCSLAIAKHGTPGMPHIFMTEFVERRTSKTLNKTVEHKCLKLGFTEDGPTEVGGIVLLPPYRGRPEKFGVWLSFIRFLFIAAHRDRFEKYVLAEFLPSFAKKGRSPLWDYFGQKFTGMSYHKADRLSMENKEFVLSLFPRGTIYQDFFPKEIVRAMGVVGGSSRPAWHLLSQIGFQYIHQVEPFDGGPYFAALTRSISLVSQARSGLCAIKSKGPAGEKIVVMKESHGRIAAVVARGKIGGGRVTLSLKDAQALGAFTGDLLWAVPLSARGKKLLVRK